MEEIARLRRHIADARPHPNRQQHDVHRREAGDREASHQAARLADLLRLGAFGAERMRAVA
jgi:hypothetical protein